MRGPKVLGVRPGAAEELQVQESETTHGGWTGVCGFDQETDQAEDKKQDAEEVEPSGETGRESVSRPDAQEKPEGGKHGGGIADDPGNEGDELGVDDLVVHDSCKSVCLTLLLLSLLVLCGVWGEAPSGKYFSAFVCGYGVLFAAFCGSARRWGSDCGGTRCTAFIESRMAVAMVGIAATGFGSTALLEVAPDVIVVAGVLGGISDGNSVGAIARKRGCSVLGAVGIVLRMGGAPGWTGRSGS